MNISDIRIRRTFDEAKLKAIVSVTFDDVLALHDIKVVQGPDRLFVAMPSRRDEKGVFRDIAHPITADFRRELERRVLQEYERNLTMQIEQSGPDQGREPEMLSEPQKAMDTPGLE